MCYSLLCRSGLVSSGFAGQNSKTAYSGFSLNFAVFGELGIIERFFFFLGFYFLLARSRVQFLLSSHEVVGLFSSTDIFFLLSRFLYGLPRFLWSSICRGFVRSYPVTWSASFNTSTLACGLQHLLTPDLFLHRATEKGSEKGTEF